MTAPRARTRARRGDRPSRAREDVCPPRNTRGREMEKPSSRADADGGGGFVSSTVRFFFFTHAGVLPRLGRTDDVDARVDGAIDSGDDRLTPSPKMPHPHGFARSLFGDATVWRSATRETRGADRRASPGRASSDTHDVGDFYVYGSRGGCGGVGARPAASRGAVAATPARAQARSVGFVGGQEARRGLALRAARGRAARGARGFEVVAQAISEVRIPPARTAPARRSRSLASRRTRRSPSRSGARSFSRSAQTPTL